MTHIENSKIIKAPRLNISLTSGSVADIELLRELLERRLKQRLSIAQVIKRMTKENLAAELSNSNTIKSWGTSF